MRITHMPLVIGLLAVTATTAIYTTTHPNLRPRTQSVLLAADADSVFGYGTLEPQATDSGVTEPARQLLSRAAHDRGTSTRSPCALAAAPVPGAAKVPVVLSAPITGPPNKVGGKAQPVQSASIIANRSPMSTGAPTERHPPVVPAPSPVTSRPASASSQRAPDSYVPREVFKRYSQPEGQ